MAYVHQDSPADGIPPTTLPPPPLPPHVVSRYVDTTPQHDLVFHILESLPANPVRGSTQLILLVHGFPDLAFGWRKVLPLLAEAGYHAVAYDLRGFGRTYSKTPLDAQSFRPMNLLKDAVALTAALGYDRVAAIVGHDFGTVTAAICALARPDVFRSVVIMSHPIKGPLNFPSASSPSYGESPAAPPAPSVSLSQGLARLERPRKHYQLYFCTDVANEDMTGPASEPLDDFLRGYFHLKSADWHGNRPHKLASFTASELEVLPRYYIMDLDDSMRQSVAKDMQGEGPDAVEQKATRWLDREELHYFATEYKRTTYRGGLNWYRLVTQPLLVGDFKAWSWKKITIPTLFLSGDADWGMYQEPGALESLEDGSFVDKDLYRGTVVVPGAGHWVNQEQPQICASHILQLAREGTGESA